VPFTSDPAQAAAAAAAFGAADAGLVIISLPPPHTPAVLEPLAAALADLA
jgi:prephenate dehydrogenase